MLFLLPGVEMVAITLVKGMVYSPFLTSLAFTYSVDLRYCEFILLTLKPFVQSDLANIEQTDNVPKII